jgi:hypothetical protein
MSTTKLGKSYREKIRDLIRSYRLNHSGQWVARLIAKWGYGEGFRPPPPNLEKILERDIKKAAREMRIVDDQKRTVRAYLPMKIEEIDEKGQKHIVDVVWDHIHEMSEHHAISHFGQRVENIQKQQNAYNRDVDSYCDNNPNAKNTQMLFRFALGDITEPQIVEQIEESPKPKRIKPR